MSFTIVSTIWGDKYDSYVPEWLISVEALQPDEVVVATDKYRDFPDWVKQVITQPEGNYPAPSYLNTACAEAQTDWIWMCDIDDRLWPDIGDVLEWDFDVIGIGYLRSDGMVYVPKNYSSQAILELDWNPIPAASPFRRHVWETNPYPDIAHQDWGFWRKAMRAGFSFCSAGRVGYSYAWHPESSISEAHANNNLHVIKALAC